MAIAATTFFSWPLLEQGSGNWLAAMNGIFVEMDKLLEEARNPLIWDTNTSGRIDTATDVLTFDGDILLWA